MGLLEKVKAQPMEARQKLPKLKNDKRLQRYIKRRDAQWIKDQEEQLQINQMD